MERDTLTIMPWEKVWHSWYMSCYALLQPITILPSTGAQGEGASAGQLACGYLGIGSFRMMVLEWAGRASLTWAHGGVVAGSLLTQWPTALRAVRG